jgi:hypothetical protein
MNKIKENYKQELSLIKVNELVMLKGRVVDRETGELLENFKPTPKPTPAPAPAPAPTPAPAPST